MTHNSLAEGELGEADTYPEVEGNPYPPMSEPWHRYNLGIEPGVIGQIREITSWAGGISIEVSMWEDVTTHHPFTLNFDANQDPIQITRRWR